MNVDGRLLLKFNPGDGLTSNVVGPWNTRSCGQLLNQNLQFGLLLDVLENSYYQKEVKLT